VSQRQFPTHLPRHGAGIPLYEHRGRLAGMLLELRARCGWLGQSDLAVRDR
jgi:hypothetical protein